MASSIKTMTLSLAASCLFLSPLVQAQSSEDARTVYSCIVTAKAIDATAETASLIDKIQKLDIEQSKLLLSEQLINSELEYLDEVATSLKLKFYGSFRAHISEHVKTLVREYNKINEEKNALLSSLGTRPHLISDTPIDAIDQTASEEDRMKEVTQKASIWNEALRSTRAYFYALTTQYAPSEMTPLLEVVTISFMIQENKIQALQKDMKDGSMPQGRLAEKPASPEEKAQVVFSFDKAPVHIDLNGSEGTQSSVDLTMAQDETIRIKFNMRGSDGDEITSGKEVKWGVKSFTATSADKAVELSCDAHNVIRINATVPAEVKPDADGTQKEEVTRTVSP